jgi:carbon dioxide concentrating mechanism protein CcmO
VSEALGLLEVQGLTSSMVALDAAEKASRVEVLQSEINDLLGVIIKFSGSVSDVRAALAAGQAAAEMMGVETVARVIPRVDEGAMGAILSPREFNPLIQQDVVFEPKARNRARNADVVPEVKGEHVSQDNSFALGFIETQGFTAVFEAIDTACKAGKIEVVGKEKLGGGYVCVIVQGELAAVTAAIEAGREKVGALGKLIAAHVLARPSPSVLALLPKL